MRRRKSESNTHIKVFGYSSPLLCFARDEGRMLRLKGALIKRYIYCGQEHTDDDDDPETEIDAAPGLMTKTKERAPTREENQNKYISSSGPAQLHKNSRLPAPRSDPPLGTFFGTAPQIYLAQFQKTEGLANQ